MLGQKKKIEDINNIMNEDKDISTEAEVFKNSITVYEKMFIIIHLKIYTK